MADPRRTLRDNAVAVLREPNPAESKTLLQLLADVRHAYHATGGKAERDRRILLVCRGEQPINGSRTVLHQIARQGDQFLAGNRDPQITRRSLDTQVIPDVDGVRCPLRKVNLRKFALFEKPRPGAFALPRPARETMGFRMLLLDEVHDSLVKAVTSDQVVPEILNLDDGATLEAAQREIQGATAPVENEHNLIAQSRQLSAKIPLGAKVTIKSGKWLVYELVHANASGTGRFPQLLPSLTREMDGNGHDRPVEVAAGQAT